MIKQTELKEKRWVLIQHNSRHYIGIIKLIDRFSLILVGLQNEYLFKRKEISIVSYKENLFILPLSEVIKKHPELSSKNTKIIEEIKKLNNYDLLLTNTLRFTKTQKKNQTNKIKKTTLWKKTYGWIKNPELITHITPILFLKQKELEFLVVITPLGKIVFLNKSFEVIKKFKNKKINVLLKKTQFVEEKIDNRTPLQKLADELLWQYKKDSIFYESFFIKTNLYQLIYLWCNSIMISRKWYCFSNMLQTTNPHY